MFGFLRKKEAPPTAPTQAPPISEVAPAPQEKPKSPGLFQRLKQQLTKTRQALIGGLSGLFGGKTQLDDDLRDELETLLLKADVGLEATDNILATFTAKLKNQSVDSEAAFRQLFNQTLVEHLRPLESTWQAQSGTHAILMVGINGAGKTTTLGKLAKRFKDDNKKVILAAGDTFRAAAVEQLQTWGERNKVTVIAQGSGADSAAVIYDGLQSAIAKNMDIFLADTAGRLHTQNHLMEELKKVKRVMQKLDPQSPQDIWLVLDASIGQNAIKQVKEFHQAVGLTGLILTKLDGTAKGGVIFALAQHFPQIPLRFIGVGETLEDLMPFQVEAFVEALMSKD